ncbi:hypothetical protein [Brassicibacter mesophilus]|uniref:hypothetical protein n=1 Tax=Brassicibacter mesophilus TaxID=745119 RepID=UPI003D1EC30C
MKNNRIYYSGLVIIITALTLGIMLDMRIQNIAPDVYDKLDTEMKYGQNQQIEYVIDDEAEEVLLPAEGKKKQAKWK